MNRKRRLSDVEASKKSSCTESREREIDQDTIQLNVNPVCSDTEAAILLLKNLLIARNEIKLFPPVIFVHQIFDIIENKTTVNRQIEILRNEKKILLIHMGTDENMKVVVFTNDLREFVMKEKNKSEMMVYQKFFDKVLPNTADIGVSKVDLLIKYRFSDIDIRTLVSTGLLILKETGLFWFSFPSAGTFMKNILKGRQSILQIIKKRKHREILQDELKRRKLDKTLDLPFEYLLHDLVGGKFLNSVKTTSGRLLRYAD